MARDVMECEWGALRGDRGPFVFGALLAFSGASVLAFLGSALAFGKGGSWTAAGVGAGLAALGAVVLARRGGTTVDRERKVVRWHRTLGPLGLGGGELSFDAFDAVEVERRGGGRHSRRTHVVYLTGERTVWLGTWGEDEPAAAAGQAKSVAEFMWIDLSDPDGLVRDFAKSLPTRLFPEEEAAREARRAPKKLVVKLEKKP